MWTEGSRFINRSNRTTAIAGMKKLAKEVSSSPYKSLFVCPEGTRTPDGSLGAFHKGALVLAIDAGLPIVPMAVIGAYEVLPKGSLYVHPGPIKVVCGDPIEAEGLCYDDREAFGRTVQLAVQSLLDQHNEPPPPR
mmetsp:Transcript_27036/g.65256  ORF Transcript_27036/g.65256 Transcript_27036/m.65256 type:complete len:136 (+) Transcript_27036:542-949(+)